MAPRPEEPQSTARQPTREAHETPSTQRPTTEVDSTGRLSKTSIALLAIAAVVLVVLLIGTLGG